MSKGLINIIFSLLVFIFVPTLNHAQEMWDSGSSYYGGYSSNYYDGRFNDPLNGYSTPDYYFSSPYHQDYMEGRYRSSGSSIHLGRSFDNSQNFTSGISSYQGTSTGPGPNGGYPGTPRGVYPTHYIGR